jgi:hypothetical protein
MNRKFIKFSPWGHFDYHEQIVGYFAIVRELLSIGLNPKFGITNEHVIASNIAEVFDLDYSSFKTINPYLHVDTKRHLLSYFGKFMDR